MYNFIDDLWLIVSAAEVLRSFFTVPERITTDALQIHQSAIVSNEASTSIKWPYKVWQKNFCVLRHLNWFGRIFFWQKKTKRKCQISSFTFLTMNNWACMVYEGLEPEAADGNSKRPRFAKFGRFRHVGRWDCEGQQGGRYTTGGLISKDPFVTYVYIYTIYLYLQCIYTYIQYIYSIYIYTIYTCIYMISLSG